MQLKQSKLLKIVFLSLMLNSMNL